MYLPPTWALATALILGAVSFARPDALPGSAGAHDAVALCHAAAQASDGAERATLLARGLALAEAALAGDERDAAAHFAVFCNLGRQLREHALGWRTLGAVRRVRRAIDRALDLAPDSPVLLTAKGVMLLELPRLLGGDAREGERLLRRALEISPGFPGAGQALAERGGGGSATAFR